MADPYYSDRGHHLSPYPAHSDDLSHEDLDHKASYDDLVDSEAHAEFAAGPRHQTVAVDASRLSPAGPGYPTRAGLAPQPSYTTGYSASEDSGPSKQPQWGYPPAPPTQPKEKESLLRRVRLRLCRRGCRV
jgi:hypothetical protein